MQPQSIVYDWAPVWRCRSGHVVANNRDEAVAPTPVAMLARRSGRLAAKGGDL